MRNRPFNYRVLENLPISRWSPTGTIPSNLPAPETQLKSENLPPQLLMMGPAIDNQIRVWSLRVILEGGILRVILEGEILWVILEGW